MNFSEALTEALNYVGAEAVATVLAPGVHRRGEVSQRTDLMEVARRAGQETENRVRICTIQEITQRLQVGEF